MIRLVQEDLSRGRNPDEMQSSGIGAQATELPGSLYTFTTDTYQNAGSLSKKEKVWEKFTEKNHSELAEV